MSKNMTTVLIVDDDPVFRQLMVKLLSEAGYYALEARSAFEAEHSLSFEPDLIIVDFRMPGMDGFAWITQLRERGNQVPIAFCSGSRFDEQKLSILRSLLRVGLIIQKPIEPAKTLEQIRKLMPPKNVGAAPAASAAATAPAKISYLSAFDGQFKTTEKAASSQPSPGATGAAKSEASEKTAGIRSSKPLPTDSGQFLLPKTPTPSGQYFYEYNPQTKITSTATDLPALSPQAIVSAGKSKPASPSSSSSASAPAHDNGDSAFLYTFEVDPGMLSERLAHFEFEPEPKSGSKSDSVAGAEPDAPPDLASVLASLDAAADLSDTQDSAQDSRPDSTPNSAAVSELCAAEDPQVEAELKELRDEYCYELPSILSLINLNLLMASGSSDMELIWSAGSCAHQIAGTAGSLGLTKISNLARQLEQLLDGLRPDELVNGGVKMARAVSLTQEARELTDNIVASLPPRSQAERSLSEPEPPAVAPQAPVLLLPAAIDLLSVEPIGADCVDSGSKIERLIIATSDKNLVHEIEQSLLGEDLFTLGVNDRPTLLAKLPELKPDVLLLDFDWLAEGESLKDLLAAVSRSASGAGAAWRPLPSLVLALLKEPAKRRQVFAAGFSDYLMLPLVEAELARRLNPHESGQNGGNI